MSSSKQLREEIIKAGRRAVSQLIKVAKEEIIKADPEPIAILIEIRSVKLVENIKVNKIPIVKPI